MDLRYIGHPPVSGNPRDARICSTPFDKLDHLSLAEVQECEALAKIIVGQEPGGHKARHRRFAELLARRHIPIYDAQPSPKGAA